MLRHCPDYIGHWGGREHYQRGEPLDTRYLVLPVRKCMCCKIRWWRYGNLHDGLCWVCAKEDYEGEEDIPL